MVVQMKGVSSVISPFEREKGHLEAFSFSRELFAGQHPRKNGCRTIGVFSPWNTRLPWGLRAERWELKGTEQVSATATAPAVPWLPITDLRQDLTLERLRETTLQHTSNPCCRGSAANCGALGDSNGKGRDAEK